AVMDLTRLAVDAGQFINRAVQYTGESLGQAERTELDPGLEELLSRADATKTWTDQIISQTEALLQPSLGVRLEDRLYQHLEWSVPPRPRAVELLGDQMTQAGLEIGSNTPYGTGLIRCGEAQKQLGEAERKFVQSTNIHFLTPLRSFTEGEYKAIQVNTCLRITCTQTRTFIVIITANLNANPLEDDYLSHVSYMFSFLRVKWLKAEMELRICQSLYNRQSEITRAVVEGLSNTHVRTLNEFKFVFVCFFTICFLKELLLFIFNACGSLPCWICFPAIYLYRPTICGASLTLWMLRLKPGLQRILYDLNMSGLYLWFYFFAAFQLSSVPITGSLQLVIPLVSHQQATTRQMNPSVQITSLRYLCSSTSFQISTRTRGL
uniref:Endophilin-B1-like n=1 Tax=Pundamilia nyererei TaxID=303518 RepID=A0A3B4FIK8_9CICH